VELCYLKKKQTYLFDKPNVIITNVETLKRRLYDPIPHSLYKYGIDLVLYDEIHLYEGLQGSYVSGLNARLNNIISSNNLPPLFVGMSATIDKPEKHCQKLFALKDKPLPITDAKSFKEKHTVEHHVILKPRLGRDPLGVAVDTTSCLIHNRRDGLGPNHAGNLDDQERPKSICFTDSRDTTTKWTDYLNDLELFSFPRHIPNSGQFRREYPIFFKPEQKNSQEPICDNCQAGNPCIAGICESYRNGLCWFFSQDDADVNSNFTRWTRPLQGRVEYPHDNIRSKRLTSKESEETRNVTDIYTHFKLRKNVPIHDDLSPEEIFINSNIDNVISTSVLEVGVDYQGIREIILYGNIRSTTSYKQRSGRGAREGLLRNGLFVMSVIQNTPLSNFYFRHFDRLVHPQLSPVKLEVKNPDIIRTQCFSSVFDYFALKSIDLFNVRDPNTKEVTAQRIEEQYKNAIKLIEERTEIEIYLKNFLNRINSQLDIIPDVIDAVYNLLQKLCRKEKIETTEKTLIEWMFDAGQDYGALNQLEKKFSTGFTDFVNKQDEITKIKDDLKGRIQELENMLVKENSSKSFK